MVYNLKIKNPATIAIFGATGSGKTFFVFEILKNSKLLFENPNCALPENTFIFYKLWTKEYENNKHLISSNNWFQEKPTRQKIEEIATFKSLDHGSTVIIDDYQQNLDADIIDVFSVLSHHLNITVIILLQSLFPTQSKLSCLREIIRNIHHSILFEQKRDQNQLIHLASQIFPRNRQYFYDVLDFIYKSKKFSYVWIDTSPYQDSILKLRTNILPSEYPISVFLPSKNKK